MQLVCQVHRNKRIESTELSERFAMLACSSCGARLGWYNEGITDEPEAYCDCCALEASTDETEAEAE